MIGSTRHIPIKEAENIERFIQPASGKPATDPVLISAYVPDTDPSQIFSVRSTPNPVDWAIAFPLKKAGDT